MFACLTSEWLLQLPQDPATMQLRHLYNLGSWVRMWFRTFLSRKKVLLQSYIQRAQKKIISTEAHENNGEGLMCNTVRRSVFNFSWNGHRQGDDSQKYKFKGVLNVTLCPQCQNRHSITKLNGKRRSVSKISPGMASASPQCVWVDAWSEHHSPCGQLDTQGKCETP